jgi:2,4-didehydro-3-deoxy-L-rhamnonate hydrolase
MTPHITPARFALGTFSSPSRRKFAGLLIREDQVIAVDAMEQLIEESHGKPLKDNSVLDIFDDWSYAFEALHSAVNSLISASTATARAAADHLIPITSLTVHPPIEARQIFLSGANYFKHVVDIIVDMGPGKTPGTEGMDRQQLRTYAEQLMTRRRIEGSPYIFTKPVSVMSGAFDPVIIPKGTQQPDWEVELAVVIGRAAHRVKRGDAKNYIGGYTIVNDITNRDQIFMKGDMKVMGTDWMTSKCRPTYLPCGPVIVPSAFVSDPQKLQITLKLNGETKQDDSTSDMIFDVARLVEHISSLIELQPGDLICTGSPAGNGTHFNRYLRPGDVMHAAITGLGEQRTPVIASEEF